MEFTLPELQYPDRLNAGDLAARRHRRRGSAPTAPALRAPDGTTWSYGELPATRQPGRAGADRGPRAWCPATGCCCARPTTRGWWPAGSAPSRPAAWSSPRWPPCGPSRSRPSWPRPSRRSRWSTTGSPRTCTPCATTRRPDLVVVEFGGAGRRRPGRAVRGEVGRVHRRGNGRRRRRAPRADVGHHRRPQAHHALPPRHRLDRRDLRPAPRAAAARRRRRLHGAARLHLRAREPSSSSRSAPARARCSPRRPRRPSSPQLVQRARGDASSFTAPTAYRAIVVDGHAGLLAGVRTAVSRRRAPQPRTRGRRSSTQTGLRIIDGIGVDRDAARVRLRGRRRHPPRARRARPCPATAPRSSTPTARRSVRTCPAGSRSSAPPAAATSTTSASTPTSLNGWNVTGDTFTRDADGYFFYQARVPTT